MKAGGPTARRSAAEGWNHKQPEFAESTNGMENTDMVNQSRQAHPIRTLAAAVLILDPHKENVDDNRGNNTGIMPRSVTIYS